MNVPIHTARQKAEALVAQLKSDDTNGKALVEQVSAKLQAELETTAHLAYVLASNCVADINSPSDCFIDVSKTQSSCLWVNVRGNLIALPLGVLVEMIEQLQLAA